METKRIENILFYKTKDNDEIKAVIFYNDGTTKEASYEDAVEKDMIALAKQNGYKTENDLFLSNRIHMYPAQSQEELDNKIHDIKRASTDDEHREKRVGLVERFKTFAHELKQKYGVKKLRASLIGLAALVGVMGFHGCSLKSATGTMENSNITTESTNDDLDNIDNVDFSIMTFEELLENTQDTNKKNVHEKLFNYQKKYNLEFANKHYDEGAENKLAHTYDEIAVQYMVYNNLPVDQLLKTFDFLTLDGIDFVEIYKAANTQDILAHVVQTESLGKEVLIESEEGKEFYKKYEDKNIEFNKATTDEEKIRIAKEFNAMVFEDFNIGGEIKAGVQYDGTENTIPGAQAALNVIYAMNTKTAQYNLALSEEQIEELNNQAYCNEAYEKLDEYANAILGQVATWEALAEEGLDTGKTGDPLYSDFRRAAEGFMLESGIDYENRDISLNEDGMFQEIVNGKFDPENSVNSYNMGDATSGQSVVNSSSTSTSYSHETKTTETSDREEAINKAGASKVEEAEQEADKEFEDENNKAKEEAEQEADQKQEEMQTEEDKHKEELEQEAEEENKKIEEEIENNGGTTDGTGAVEEDEPLPDPNDYIGKDITTSSSTTTTDEEKSEIADYIYETEEEIILSSETSEEKTVEEKAQAIIDELEKAVPAEEITEESSLTR